MILKPSRRADAIPEYYFQKKGRELAALADAGADIINLGLGTPDLPPSQDVIKALCQKAASGSSHGYQPYNGTPALRTAMADWYRRIYDVSLDPESEILPLLGSKEGIIHISLAFLDPGDEVLVPDPGYNVYAAAAIMAGATPIPYNLTEANGWLPDMGELASLASRNTKLVWLNYPNMPTGTVASEGTFRELVAWCRQRGILLCHDNPYSLILNDSPPLSIMRIPEARDCCLELNSLSKSHRMAGWRVGLVVGKADSIRNVLKIKANIDSGMFLPVQQAAIEALAASDDWYAEQDALYRRRREIVWRMLDIMGFSFSREQAGLFVWASAPDAIDDVAIYTDELLQTKSVFITPGAAFGHNGRRYIRVSLCVPEDHLAEAIARIQS